MKKFRDLAAKVRQSRMGDALSSRLPSHLEDPRDDTATTSPREKKLDNLVDNAKEYFKVPSKLKESTWESYRTKALEETKLHHTLKGHPYHYKSNDELHYIIKDAHEAEKAIGSHDNRASWKYGDQQNDAASILGYRQRGGKQLEHPKPIHEVTEREAASHKDRIGSTLDANKKGSLDTKKKPKVPVWAPSWGQKAYDDAAKKFEARKKGGAAQHFNEEAPHPGHQMTFTDRTEHQYFGGEEARKDRDAFAKHLKSQGHKVKLGSLRNQILHGSYGHVYSVTHKTPWKSLWDLHPGAELNESGPEGYKVGDHVVHKIGPHKHQLEEYAKSGIEAGHYVDYDRSYKHSTPLSARKQEAVDHEQHLEKHGYVRTTGPKTDEGHHQWTGDHKSHWTHPNGQTAIVRHADSSSDVTWRHKDPGGHGKEKDHGYSLDTLKKRLDTIHKKSLEESTKTYQVGDHVVPKIGPHKGQVHRVIHVHPTGHVNITPENSGYGRKNRYHLGAARAHPNDLEDAPGHGSKKYRNLAENPIVREAFEAAKSKKKGENPFAKKDDKDTKVKPNDFQEPKELKSPGQQDPQQADTQGQLVSPGAPNGAPVAPVKQSNAPKPEKKTDKLAVKGPGADDQFQTEPTVAGLTTLVKA